ncbi:MAG TPA: carbohydrate binding domain-containing protein [Pseudonocardiaceae bacterium]|jgi:hypothetical protein|nr:carbohydrate binding domain-containing protein [Pseudonocardiaceae bacterium]
MPLPKFVMVAAAAAATTVTAAGLLITGAGAASAATLPTHFYAPYFEAWMGDSPATLSQQSGAKDLTLAFLQTASQGSCTIDWNGDTSTPVSSATYGSDITSIRAAGGDVIPSLGGYTADTTNTEIADSCTNVASIAAAYESLVTTYGVTRIDLDVEADSLNNTAGIDRRNKAIAMAEAWGSSTGHTIQFQYTIPTNQTSLNPSETSLMQDAISDGAVISEYNIMTFDYYTGTPHEMATDTETAAASLESELAGLYPSKSSAQLWAMVGITEMMGIDDYGAAETFTTADATTVENWAVSKGISELSYWALQRDNGGCVGTGGSGTCSGVSQSTWQFSKAFEPFAGGTTGTPTNDFSLSVSPASASIAPGASTTAKVSTAVTSGSAQSVSLSAGGAPAGVTVSFNPASVTAGGSSTVTVAASSTAAAGTYSITLTGAAASGSHTAALSVTVTGSGGTGGGSLTNAGLESGSLSPWTCQPGGAVVSSPVHSGSHALQAAATSSQTGECDQTITVSANSSHTLKAWVQGNYAYVGVSGGATASTWASGSGWTQLTVPFTTGASGTVTVYVHGWYAQGNVYADDFTVS